MDQVSRRTLHSADFETAYYRKGKGTPLLLIPAFHTDSERLMPLVTYLSEWFDVILPELPGIGNSKTLGHQKHTAYNYALYIKILIRHLKLKNYVLCGLCFGASIAIHLLNMDITRPKAILFFEAIFSKKYIFPEFPYNIIIPFFIFMGKIGINRLSIVNFLLHNKTFLLIYFRTKYRHERNIDAIISNQIRLTDTMNTRAWTELIDDIFSTDFTDAKIFPDIPAYLIYIDKDQLINTEKNSSGMKRLFPVSEVFSINYDYHAPPDSLKPETVSKLIEPIKPIIQKIRIRNKNKS